MARETRRKISIFLSLIVSLIWIYLGITKAFVENKTNVIMIIFGVVIIALNLSMLKDIYYPKKLK